MNQENRACLGFKECVHKHFSFLTNLGFVEVQALPTLVRYEKGDIEVDVYHGRQSYEVGAGITVSGERYAISEILRANGLQSIEQFRYATAVSADGVAKAVAELGALLRKHGHAALNFETCFIAALTKQRERWAEDYALEVLAGQLRPKAQEAFRQGDYSTAADLYSRIQKDLSTAELRKLQYAAKRAKVPML